MLQGFATFEKISVMETASLTGVIRLLFYFFLFYFVFRIAMRLLLPVLLKKAVEKAEDNLRNMQSGQNSYQSPQPETDRPRERKKVGEYIDYEEIE